jgi:hypothetical protein
VKETVDVENKKILSSLFSMDTMQNTKITRTKITRRRLTI